MNLQHGQLMAPCRSQGAEEDGAPCLIRAPPLFHEHIWSLAPRVPAQLEGRPLVLNPGPCFTTL